MKNKMKRVLAFVVAFAMVFTLMPGNYSVSKAADVDPIDVTDEGSYKFPEDVEDTEGIPKFYDATASSYGNVVVPGGCEFNINIDCTIESLTIKEGGRVNVFIDWETDPNNPKGYNVAIGEITAESDAVIMIGGNSEITVDGAPFPFMSWDGQASYEGEFDWTEFVYIVDEETSEGKWCEIQTPPGSSFISYGPIEFNVMELHGRGEVQFKVESDSLGTNSGVLFNVDGNEDYDNEAMSEIFKNYTLSAGDKITIYANPINEGDELVHLGYDLGGEDVFNNDNDARWEAITAASSENGYTIELTENTERIHFEMDFQNPNGGEPGSGLNEGEIGVEIFKQENGSISIAKVENVEPRIVFEDDFYVLYAYDKSVLDNAGELTVNIVPNENYKVAEFLSYANNECFKNIDTDGSSGFRNEDGSYTYKITGSMYDLEVQKDTVRIDVEFIEDAQEEGGANPAENEGLKATTEEGYVSSKFTVKGKGADGVSVDVVKNSARTTMVYRGEDERAFEKYYRAYGELPYATTLDARDGYYRYDEGEKVCLQFSFNFMYRLKSLKINGTDYGVTGNTVTTFGGDEVTFDQLCGDKADRAILLRAFQDQNFGCTVEVDREDAYVIELEVIPVDGYFTERESEDGRRYGNDVVIGNFLWFPTGGYAEDDAMTNGHLEIVSYEVSEADAAALKISEALRKGTINSDSSFGEPGTSFYFHSPSDGSDGNTRANGEAVFPVGTKLVCKLVPDYGYQLAEFSVNGAPLTPLKEVSTFDYTVGQGNFHFGATFVPAENKLDCEASENVSAVTIANDENAAESGTLALTVTDEATIDEKVTSEYGEAISTIDLTLVNEVKKSETEYWETAISEFENPVTISLTLDPTEFTEDSYKVVRNHITEDSNGVKTNVVEELENVSYDKTTGELSFETNKFSAYTIVKAPCEHTYVAEVNSKITGQVASVATCASKAKYYKYCSKCNELSTETFEAGDVDLTNHVGERGTKNVKVATCTEKGYSGDIYCKSCNTVITEGQEISSLGHSYVAKVNPAIANQLVASATCISKAKYYKYCSECNELSTDTFEYGEFDKTNHTGEKEIRDTKAATCGADGYTGDTYCKSCNTKLSDGEAIKATGKHTYDSGKVTKEPTVDAEGVKTYTCTVCGATKTEAIAKLPKPVDDTPAVNVSYHTHIQTLGDSQGVKTNGQMAGTSGQAKRLENIWIKVEGNKNLGIQYSTHCQSYGWMTWTENGKPNGTSGEAKRLEAIKIELTGADRDKYDVYYRVHAQSYGWLAWVKNGASAGTAGLAKRLEGIQIVVVKKGEAAPGLDYADVKASAGVHSDKGYICGSTSESEKPGIVTVPNVMYKTHVQTYGWEQNWKKDGEVSGTSGEAKRLEAINIKLSNCEYEGGIQYITHVQTYGWSQGWKKDGEMSGTRGEAKRLEAIKIDLTGELKKHYDVYYRVHVQSYGWLAWAKNGEAAGTEGLAKRAEGIQIIILPKGEIPPANYEGIQSVQTKALIK